MTTATRRIVTIAAALLAACSTTPDAPDAWSADAGFHGCRWVDPPTSSVCDGFQWSLCASWAVDLARGSDLEVFAQCRFAPGMSSCISADQYFDDAGTACGSGPGCPVGSACGRLTGETETRCIPCAR